MWFKTRSLLLKILLSEEARFERYNRLEIRGSREGGRYILPYGSCMSALTNIEKLKLLINLVPKVEIAPFGTFPTTPCKKKR